MINMFYISLALAMILLLLVIYLVRAYIHRQMRKHAIHDHVTGLFNKKYFMSELKTLSARSIRYKSPLSIVSISISNLDKYDKKTKNRMLGIFGELLHNTTRESDVVCRYDENHFAVLVEDPDEANALQCKERIEEVLEKYDFKIDPKPRLQFSVSVFDEEESVEEFAKRALN
jgi:diguanylate cyclase (GGDEF)-like protein